MKATQYMLKETLNGEAVLDGIIPGIGVVTHGVPVTPYSEAQAELLKADPRFKQYRETVQADADAGVTGSAKVDTKAEAAPTKKTADSGKEG